MDESRSAADSVATRCLGAIERGIRTADRVYQSRAHEPCHTDAYREGDRLAADIDFQLGDAGAQAFADLQRLRLGRAGKHRAELLAAVARHQVALPQPTPREGGERDQRSIATGVTESAIHFGEVVEIDHQDAGRRLLPCGMTGESPCLIHEEAPIGQSCQFIRRCHRLVTTSKAVIRHHQQAYGRGHDADRVDKQHRALRCIVVGGVNGRRPWHSRR
jgi:hypothetical protein